MRAKPSYVDKQVQSADPLHSVTWSWPLLSLCHLILTTNFPASLDSFLHRGFPQKFLTLWSTWTAVNYNGLKLKHSDIYNQGEENVGAVGAAAPKRWHGGSAKKDLLSQSHPCCWSPATPFADPCHHCALLFLLNLEASTALTSLHLVQFGS